MADFPETIKYSDLQVNHADYNPEDVLGKYEALYAGGKKFRDGIEQYEFLDKRQLDGYGDKARPQSSKMNPEEQLAAAAKFMGAQNRWNEKKKVARYINYVGGLLDYFIQAIFKDEPQVIAKGDYWSKFNKNANGKGSSLSTVSRKGMLGTLKFFRSYLSLIVTKDTSTATSLGQQKAAKGLDAVMDILSAIDVNHWKETDDVLEWVRTYRKDNQQVQVFGNPTSVRELWTYITATDLIDYEIIYDINKPPTPDTLVKKKDQKKHGFPSLPVIPIKINCDLWAMQRLEDPCLALYNRETALTVLINSAAFQILGISTGEAPANVPDTTMGALWLGMGGKAEFIGPQGQAFDAQFRDAVLKKSNLYEVFQAMGTNALAVQPQNARQSNDAKETDKEPLYALLITYANALLEALTAAVELNAEFRGDASDPKVSGLKNFDLASLQEKLKNLLFVQDVQGFPETARRKMLEETAIACVPTASIEDKDTIRQEAEDADLEPPEIIPVIPDKVKGPIPKQGQQQP